MVQQKEELSQGTNKNKNNKFKIFIVSLCILSICFFISYKTGILDRLGLYSNTILIDKVNLSQNDLSNIKLSFVQERDTTNLDLTGDREIILTDWYGKYHLFCCVYRHCFRIAFDDFKFDGYRKVKAKIVFKCLNDSIFVDWKLKTKWEEVIGEKLIEKH